MKYVYKYLPYIIAVLSIVSVQQWLNITLTPTTVAWLIEACILIPFAIIVYRGWGLPEYRLPWQYIAFYSCVLISALYGIFMSSGYWDLKNLINNFIALSLPLSYSYFAQPVKLSRVFSVWTYFAIITFPFLVIFMQPEAVGRFLVPASFMLLFLPYYNRKQLWILFIMTACVFVFGSFGARSNIMRVLAPLALGIGLYFRQYFSVGLLRTVVISALALPFFLILLASTGTFNIFNFQDYLRIDSIEVGSSFDDDQKEDLSDDTRTFIYLEELSSAINNDYLIFGRSLARGYDSDYFKMADNDTSDRGERASSEVGNLNIFNYMGVVGLLLYFMVFVGAAVSVFRRSCNKTMHFVLIYVMFRWIWGWVEDFTIFDLNMLVLWIAFAMCYSPRFLNMTDTQIASWARTLIGIR